MAKRRKARTRRAVSRVKRTVKRATKDPLMTVAVPSAIYGALRSRVSNALTPITEKVPLGSIADELVMGGASYLLAKNAKGIAKKIGMAGLTIESARLGEAVSDGSIGFGGMIPSNNNAGNSFR
ncbi:hypothetical protein GOV10_01040 [Candidatus Woesearchaeota archaeon]|nr:hypothetical protein [Candidatus Woesearchaeota archaeon]